MANLFLQFGIQIFMPIAYQKALLINLGGVFLLSNKILIL
ncbi:hypothetical protein IMAU60049_03066 [Lactiplantibacillus plantarum]|nr:hypothetical protein [Lactiplantibacillus plantarum]